MRLLVTLYLLLQCGSLAAAECEQSHLGGIFFQPLYEDLELSSTQWRQRIASLRKAGIDRLYLQWTAYGDADFLNAQTVDGESFLLTIFDELDQQDMELHLGLVADPEWFSQIDVLETEELESYLAELRADSHDQADSILETYPQLQLAGWYIPEEIAAVHWRAPEKLELLVDHLQATTEEMNRLTPDAAVTVSAFASEFGDSEAYVEFISTVSKSTGVVILHQDGSGTRALPRVTRDSLLEQLEDSLEAGRWEIIVELFRQQSDADSAFAAVPADITDLMGQLEQRTSLHPELPINGFSLRYLLEDDGRLLNEFVAYYCRNSSAATDLN